MHRLTDIDEINRLASCLHCGRVRVTKLRNGYRCGTATYLGDVRRKYGYRISTKPDRCEVCGSSNRIVYDHSHDSEQFRGWLCNACNVALGLVRDNAITLRLLADYIERNTPKGASK